jgi:hypothetical protein
MWIAQLAVIEQLANSVRLGVSQELENLPSGYLWAIPAEHPHAGL